MTVDLLAQSVTAIGNWFDVWAAAVAVQAMCVTQGFGGSSVVFGMLQISFRQGSLDVGVGMENNGTAVS